jgi:RNA polymerase sigma factor (sigma-70 family)
LRTGADPEDQTLVAAVRAGDDGAFEHLFRRYQRPIGAYVYGMVRDHGRAEDITQDVFVSALRRMRATQAPIAFKPWIYEIAKNACIDAFRRSRRAEEVSYDADHGAERLHLVSNGPTPDAAVDTRMSLDHLRGAFGGLSDAHHQILVMREFEGLSYREIGERLGMSRPSVESTLFRARRRLSEEYEELASGERCRRIHAIIAGANDGRVGVRDERKMARHVSHCQPCRRAALAAGFDPASLERRRTVRERIAALLPLPAVLRRWVAGPGADHGALWGAAGHYAEPMSGGWMKAAAAALLIAGAGVDAVRPHAGGAAPERGAPAAAAPVSPAAIATVADRHTVSTTGAGTHSATSSDRRTRHGSSASHGSKKGAAGASYGGGGSSAGSGGWSAGGGGSSSSNAAPSRGSSPPSGSSSGGPVNDLTKTVTDKLPTGSGGGGSAPQVPSVKLPAPRLPAPQLPAVPGAPPAVNNTVGAVNNVAGGATGAVNNVAGAATGTVNGVTGAATGAVNNTVGATTGTTKAVGDTVKGVTGGGILGGG